ncbi:hypothetical protein ACI3L1_14070 [Deinococcus sp. SM5_A1]|uniref:hypothetical protein n=1 Tax=Deinococcus sp. SM5_A1 TaxID=3379094 RepID=UPI003859A578
MKKLTVKRKIYLVKRQRKLDFWSGKNRKRQRTFRLPSHVYGTPIKMPSAISISDETFRNRMVRIYDLIIHNSRIGKNFTLDFSPVKHIQPTGMLLLFAHLKHIIYKNPLLKISGILPKNTNSKVGQVIRQIGLSNLILCDSRDLPTDEDVIYWQVTSGRMADGSKTEPILQNIEKYYSEEVITNLYEGLTEAMINVKQHAYKSDIKIDIDGDEWWMFFQIKDGWFDISICDIGIGIPKSINDNFYQSNKNIFNAFSSNRRDSESIKAAIKLGRSRTQEDYRGKGLPQIVNALDNVAESKIAILSGHGAYIRTNDEVKIERDFRTPIRGTVLSWSLPLIQEVSA